jgi:hypothetical protein
MKWPWQKRERKHVLDELYHLRQLAVGRGNPFKHLREAMRDRDSWFFHLLHSDRLFLAFAAGEENRKAIISLTGKYISHKYYPLWVGLGKPDNLEQWIDAVADSLHDGLSPDEVMKEIIEREHN